MTTAPDELTVLADGFAATECPRWHDGRLWFSDMHGGIVVAMTPDGEQEVVAEVNGPGGLGFLPDGRLLVVSQRDRQVLRREPDGLVLHADLSDRSESWVNDMWVDPAGRAFVGQMGFDVHAAMKGELAPEDVRNASVFVIQSDGTVGIGAEDLQFPNGIVLGLDEHSLLVAESRGLCISEFRIGGDGSLGDKREWCRLDFAPDGITLDVDGCLWIADPHGHKAVRVAPGGEVLQELATDGMCLSLALGGDDGRTLYVCTTEVTDPEDAPVAKSSHIEQVRVDVPGLIR